MNEAPSGAAIRARGLSKRFGPVEALQPLDLEVAAGATLAVLGPNGAGKSTLLRLLAGLSRPSAGELVVGAAGSDRRERRRQVGLIAHATLLYPALTAHENLLLAGRLWGVSDPAGRARALLEQQDLGAVADRPAGSFSRGMAQRLAIARALVHEPDVLLLDEPFTGLDPRAADRLAEQLTALRQDGRTAVLVTHDLARAAELAGRGLVLVGGRAAALSPELMGDGASAAAGYRDAVASLERGRGTRP